MKNLRFSGWVVPLVLFLLAFFSFGIYIPSLGIYGDDWPHLWVYHLFGERGYIDLLAWDRPLSVWVYLLVTPLLGENIVAYHALLATLRFACAFVLWRLLGRLWPENRSRAAWVAVLFLIYPGFRQQAMPFEFILHFSVLLLFLLSLLTMLTGISKTRKAWAFTGLSVILSSSMFSLEYFIGLELLRPVLIWMVLARDETKKLKRFYKTILCWIPYLIVLASMAIWRFFFFKFPTYKPTFVQYLSTDPLKAMLELGLGVITDLRAVTLGAWRQVFTFSSGTLSSEVILLAVTSLILLWLVFRYLPTHEKSTGPVEESLFIPAPLLLGGFALLVAGIPFWVTGLPVELTFPWDRATLPFMLGGSLMVVGLLELFRFAWRIPLFAGLVALTLIAHYQNATVFKDEWNKFTTFFWQLTWRAPGLKPGTILISDQIPLNFYGDNNLTPPLNWTYAPNHHSTEIPYNFFDLGERLGTNLPALEENLPVYHGYRFLTFHSNSSNALVVSYKPGECVRVPGVDPVLSPDLPTRLRQALRITHQDQIIMETSTEARPPSLLGPEPAHGWCYYYEKADLYRQAGDWQKVTDLAGEAEKLELVETNPLEFLPFIEGFIRLENWERAAVWIDRFSTQSGDKIALCKTISISSQSTNAKSASAERMTELNRKVGCE